MRKKFRPVFPLFLILTSFALAACGGSGDEDDPLDRELDLAMAEDSLAALADTTLAVYRQWVDAPEDGEASG